MNNLFRELQERGVIRVVGLYGAIVWLALQASDVLFPAFDIPDSAVRMLLFGALGLLPIVTLLAWFYEITDHGIQLETEVKVTGAKRLWSRNEIYFVIIGVLAVALLISVYLNIQESDSEDNIPAAFISVLIADFDNLTGDPLFDHSVEEALTIGVEGASFISSYNRHRAVEIVKELNEGVELNNENARLVAIREGINLVLLGTISFDGREYSLELKAVEPVSGDMRAEVASVAAGKLEVLQAVSSLATQLRSEFGDAGLDEAKLVSGETFSARSLKAMQFYANAQQLAQQGDHRGAIGLYEAATTEDKFFGRAYSGWALSVFELGQTEEAERLWEKTLPLLDGMTSRERYRTLGVYYAHVSRNYGKSVENYAQLVKEFPADNVGRSNLAVSYFLNRNFDQALKVGGSAAELYPNEKTVQSNYVLFAMYAGEFKKAIEASERLTQTSEPLFKVYLGLAVAKLVEQDPIAARAAYEAMSRLGPAARSLAEHGLADAALAMGEEGKAIAILETGITFDEADDRRYFLASKLNLLAMVLLDQAEVSKAEAAIDRALEASSAVAPSVTAAMLYARMGAFGKADDIGRKFRARLQSEERAYGDLIEGCISLTKGDAVAAVDAFASSINKTDTWLGHHFLGRAYLAADVPAEALTEFELGVSRIGEATSIFLDDIPTFHRVAENRYWLAVAQVRLGMRKQARENLQVYLKTMSPEASGDMVVDARAKLAEMSFQGSSD